MRTHKIKIYLKFSFKNYVFQNFFAKALNDIQIQLARKNEPQQGETYIPIGPTMSRRQYLSFHPKPNDIITIALLELFNRFCKFSNFSSHFQQFQERDECLIMPVRFASSLAFDLKIVLNASSVQKTFFS